MKHAKHNAHNQGTKLKLLLILGAAVLCSRNSDKTQRRIINIAAVNAAEKVINTSLKCAERIAQHDSQ